MICGLKSSSTNEHPGIYSLHPYFHTASYVQHGTDNIPRLLIIAVLFSGLWGSRQKNIQKQFIFKAFQTIYSMKEGKANRVSFSLRFPNSWKKENKTNLSNLLGLERQQLSTWRWTLKCRDLVYCEVSRLTLKFFLFIFSCLSTQSSLWQDPLRKTLKYDYSWVGSQEDLVKYIETVTSTIKLFCFQPSHIQVLVFIHKPPVMKR